ncbi:MAG: hypothetical protein ABJE95_33035 [Byssovorax sp.]
MILVARTYWGGAPFDFRSPPRASVEPTAIKGADGRDVRGLYWTPEGTPRPRVAAVAMHPRVDFTRHYTFPRLVEAGIGCLGANTRSPNNDTDLEHEAMVLDLAACLRWLRAERGVEQVVLLGNCGGGSLAAFFQAEARLPPSERLSRTPAGGPTRFAAAEMIPADAMIYVAAHRGQGKVLGACIDPSVTDESDPHATDPDLDMYDVRNGFRPPPEWSEYPEDFVARYRRAQHARVVRLDARARELLADSRAAADAAKDRGFAELPFEAQQRIQRRAACEPVMVVYRTMANLHGADRRLDPSGREYGSLLSDRPDLMNQALLGFGRICTPRAWLSTWSSVASNADLVRNLARIPTPTLVVHAGRDREITPRTDAAPIFAAVAAPDRTLVEQPEARHYFEPDFGEAAAPEVERLMDTMVGWIRERFELSPRRAPVAAPAPAPARHPTSASWRFPPPGRSPLPGGLRRVNLHELAARPGRFEHHLVVVAEVGRAQLEIVTASEPLAFGHCNISDEYALALPTGDAMIDAFPLRTFLADPASLADVGRLNHRAGDLVLHPHGLLHWPGRLRAPYDVPRFPAGMRRCGLSLVYCASLPSPPTERPLFVSAGRDADAKAYGEGIVPFLLAETGRDPGATLAAVGDTTLDLLVAPRRIAAPRGGYLVVLDAAPESLHFAGDLVHIPPGGAIPTEGLRRALLLSSPSAAPAAPPPSWDEVPGGPFAVLEDAAPGALPLRIGTLTADAASPQTVTLRFDGHAACEVPRFWLARMLFRVALHAYAIGYVETYGGFYYDDRGGDYRLGLRGHGHVELTRDAMIAAIPALYRAVAPAGYTERPA